MNLFLAPDKTFSVVTVLNYFTFIVILKNIFYVFLSHRICNLDTQSK